MKSPGNVSRRRPGNNREDFWMRGGTGLEESRCEAGGPAPALLPWDT